jgi:hypothetical protein
MKRSTKNLMRGLTRLKFTAHAGITRALKLKRASDMLGPYWRNPTRVQKVAYLKAARARYGSANVRRRLRGLR